MKNISKLLGIVLIIALVMSLSVSAFAASITVSQDSTYAGTAGEAGRTFTYKQIFHATLSGANTSTGGGYDTDGTPGTVTASLQKGYSYFLKSTETTQIGQLGTWVAAAAADDPATTDVDESVAHWVKASGNLWFKLTPSADGTQYIVEWDNTSTDTDTAQAAAAWLSKNYTPVATGSLTWDSTSKTWKATDLDDGYYLLSSDTGDNLIAATGDIQVKEKNSYPPLEKTQADEDDNVQTDQDKNVAVGDVLTYEVKVTIPATAAVGEKIKVYDNPSKGLQYNNNVTVKTNEGNATVAAATGDDVVSGAAWTQIITVTEGSIGKVVVFTFTMTVTKDALEDPDKVNPAGLVYNNYNSIPDTVKFKTYFAGIHKIDGDTNYDLAGVEFVLKEAGAYFAVSKVSGADYYVPVAAPDTTGMTEEEAKAALEAAATVVTDAQGMIRIRGLDKDKKYTLTETKTLDGYNMISGDITLDLYEDTYTVTTSDGTTTTTTSYDPDKTKDTWGEVENNKGTVLPSTGGIGTTIFYVVGSILVVAAGVLLITKKRMSKEG